MFLSGHPCPFSPSSNFLFRMNSTSIMKLLLTRMTIGTLLPRHSGGKFNLECNAGSELLPLPGVDIGARKEGIPLLF